MGESGKGNGKVRVGDNVLPVNLLLYLAEAYLLFCIHNVASWNDCIWSMISRFQNGEGVVTKFACSRTMCITRMNKDHTSICNCGLITQEFFFCNWLQWF